VGAFNRIIRTVVAENELTWLEALREASGNTDPALTSRRRALIRALFGG
jgi:hypothetical protein